MGPRLNGRGADDMSEHELCEDCGFNGAAAEWPRSDKGDTRAVA